MAIWRDEPELMDWLRDLQNHPLHTNIDIMSFADMCASREELLDHCWRYEWAVMKHNDGGKGVFQ